MVESVTVSLEKVGKNSGGTIDARFQCTEHRHKGQEEEGKCLSFQVTSRLHCSLVEKTRDAFLTSVLQAYLY